MKPRPMQHLDDNNSLGLCPDPTSWLVDSLCKEVIIIVVIVVNIHRGSPAWSRVFSATRVTGIFLAAARSQAVATPERSRAHALPTDGLVSRGNGQGAKS